MVGMNPTRDRRHRALLRTVRLARRPLALGLLCLSMLATVGCSGADGDGAEGTRGAGMAGPSRRVVVSQSAIADKPEPWVLTTPESAVRSYLDWVSYAYRIGESSVATATMTVEQEVLVDSYNQKNLQDGRLIDQKLDELILGEKIAQQEKRLIPAKERWTYRYVSIEQADKTLEGPFEASYETTYTVVKNEDGAWVVGDVEVKAVGEVE